MICTDCGIGTLTESTWGAVFRGCMVTGLECFRCSHCGADPVTTDQIRRNESTINDRTPHITKGG